MIDRTETLAAFLMPGSHERLLWTWCCSHQDAPLTVEQRARLDELATMYRDVREAMSDWTPHWPDAPLLPLDFRTGVETAASIVESESGPLIVDQHASGLALLDADPAAVVRELLRVHRTDEPHRWHYLAAAAALRREGADVTPEARNTLAEKLRDECCRLRLPEAAGLDELNAIAFEAIERVSGEKLDDTRAKVRERPLYWWAEHDGLGHELRFTRALAQSLRRRSRKLRAGLPIPLMTVLIRSGVERPELASDGRLQHRADDGRTRAAAAQVHLAERALGDTAPPGVVPLAAYLATVCYQQHRLGLDEASAKSVAIPSTSRDSLRPFGIETPAELRAALDWLQATSIGDPRFDSWTCVTGHGQAGDGRRSSAKGGRPPRPGYVVDVGYPLAPFAVSRLQNTFIAHGMTPPPSLGFFAPVLPVELAPPAARNSYGPTHKRQLDAYCMALPLVLMERREEYAEHGILLDDLRAPLKKVGIYSRGRGDTSLFDSLSAVWTAMPEPALFATRTSPVLVPVEPGSTRYRLGPDYPDADGMIVDAAGFTEQQRKAGKTGRDKLMMRRTKR